jgi:hypothetical protein
MLQANLILECVTTKDMVSQKITPNGWLVSIGCGSGICPGSMQSWYLLRNIDWPQIKDISKQRSKEMCQLRAVLAVVISLAVA